MSQLLDKLNLRPQERRLVVASAVVLFVVLQFWFVRPYFAQWTQVRSGLSAARRSLETYRAELAKTNEYQLKLRELEGQNAGVLAADQAQPNILIRQVQDQLLRSKLGFIDLKPVRSPASRTNQFFEEQPISLTVTPAGDDDLIDFMVAMGSSDLKIRIKDLKLDPDPTGTKLKGSMLLVANFQKAPAVKLASPPPTATATNKP
jgi:hypothetical protein